MNLNRMQNLKRKSQTLKLNCLMFKARNNELWKKSKDLQIAMQIFKDISTNSLLICRYTESNSDVFTIRFYISTRKWRNNYTLNMNDSHQNKQMIIKQNSPEKWTESSQKKFRRSWNIEMNSSTSYWKIIQSDMLWHESSEQHLQSVSSSIWFLFIS